MTTFTAATILERWPPHLTVIGLPGVYTVLKLDERRDKEQSLADKVRSVEERLEEK